MDKLPFQFLIAIFLLPALLQGQTNQSEIEENFKMELVYQLGFVIIPVGELWFKKYIVENNQQPGYMLEANGANFESYDWIYRFSSYHKAVINSKNDQLIYFEHRLDQNGEQFQESYHLDKKGKKISSKITDNTKVEKIDTTIITENVKDILSAFELIRFLDFDKMQLGLQKPMALLLNGTICKISFDYEGKENIVSPDRSKHQCYKIIVGTITGSVFKNGDELIAWISTDKNRIPVQIKADVKVGSVCAYMKNDALFSSK